MSPLCEVLPGAPELEVYDEINEDWLSILRVRRVLGPGTTVRFEVEISHNDRAVEDQIDTVGADYLTGSQTPPDIADLTRRRPPSRTPTFRCSTDTPTSPTKPISPWSPPSCQGSRSPEVEAGGPGGEATERPRVDPAGP